MRDKREPNGAGVEDVPQPLRSTPVLRATHSDQKRPAGQEHEIDPQHVLPRFLGINKMQRRDRNQPDRNPSLQGPPEQLTAQQENERQADHAQDCREGPQNRNGGPECHHPGPRKDEVQERLPRILPNQRPDRGFRGPAVARELMNQDLVPGVHPAVEDVLDDLRPEAAGDGATGVRLVPPEHLRAQAVKADETSKGCQCDRADAHPAEDSIFSGSWRLHSHRSFLIPPRFPLLPARGTPRSASLQSAPAPA